MASTSSSAQRCVCLAFLLFALLVSFSTAELDATHGRSLKQIKQFRVIAFGDSTTEGWVPTQKKFLPYTTTLQAKIQQKLPKYKVTVVNKGLGASTVVPLPKRPVFTPFCKAEYSAALKSKIVYDWVVVWIGQNDLLLGNTPDAMMKTLKPFFNFVLKSGSSLLIVSPVNYKEIAQNDPKEQLRQRYTTIMQSYAAAVNAILKKRGKKNVARTLDLLAINPYNPWKLSKADYPKYFEEWHLSEGGYKALAVEIFNKMK